MGRELVGKLLLFIYKFNFLVLKVLIFIFKGCKIKEVRIIF